MLVPVPMQKVNIFVARDDIVDVIIALGRFHSLDLIEGGNEGEWQADRGGCWGQLSDRYESLARRLSSLIDVLDLARDDASEPQELAPASNTERFEHEVSQIEDLVQDWQENRRQAERRVEQLGLIVQGLRDLAPLDLSLEDISSLERLHVVFGTLPEDSSSDLRVVLFRIPFVLVPFADRDGAVLILAASARENAPILDRALKSAWFHPLALPEDATGRPVDLIGRYEERLKEAEQELKQLQDQKTALAREHGPKILSAWLRAESAATVAGTIGRLPRRGKIYVIPGWVPQSELDHLLEAVREAAREDAHVETIGARAMPSEQVPTLLRNPRLLRPFEMLVSVFGFPSYNEVDPTLVVALTYVLMYGMMFGDLGHGLLLAGIGLLIVRLRPANSSIAWIMVAAGGCAALFGVLYGSVFGLENVLPHLWLQPLHSITTILLVSVGAGVGLLNVGFILHLTSAGRVGDWTTFFLSRDGLAGFILYWVLLGGVLSIVEGISIPLGFLALGVLVPASVLFFRQPLSRLAAGQRPLLDQGWGQYGVESFFELFEAIVSYISNSISFVRLGAFAVAHAGLSLVMFSIADRTQGPGRWLVLVLGTVLIVGFEGLIVAIQALRLEYYEFFGKFLTGGGHPFRPFGLYERQKAPS
jgi:V/A-type H+-transporting ATPase subunit I